MHEPYERRINEVRGEPLDEVRFLSHLAVDTVYDRLPPEFWHHLKTARAEVREALLVLLRAWIEYLSREADEERGPVSRQRGKIVVADTAPTSTEAAAPAPLDAVNGNGPPHAEFTPAPAATVSRQRAKIGLD